MKLEGIPKGTKRGQIKKMIFFLIKKHEFEIFKASLIHNLNGTWKIVKKLGKSGKLIEEKEVKMKSNDLTEKLRKKLEDQIKKEQINVTKMKKELKEKLNETGELSEETFKKQEIWFVYLSFKQTKEIRMFKKIHTEINQNATKNPENLQNEPEQSEHMRLFSQMKISKPEFPSNILWKNHKKSRCHFFCCFLGVLCLILLMMLISFVANSIMIFIRIQAEHNISTKQIMYSCPADEEINLDYVETEMNALNPKSELLLYNINAHFEFYKFFKNTQRKLFCVCQNNASNLENLKTKYSRIYQYCQTFMNDSFFKKYSGIIAFLVLFTSNLVLEIFVVFILKLVPFKLRSSRRTAQYSILYCIFMFNFLLMFFLYKTEFMISLIYQIRYLVEDVEVKVIVATKTTFEQFGNYIMVLIMLELTRGIKNFIWHFLKYVYKNYKFERRTAIQSKLVKFGMPPHFELEECIAYMFTVFSVSIFFATQNPLILGFCSCSFVVSFWSEKLNLLLFSRRPTLNLRIPIIASINCMIVFLLVCVGYTIRTYGNPSLFFTSNFPFFPDRNYLVTWLTGRR